MIIAVTGLSRCGTTLMMLMLNKGGMDVFCDNKVSYETELIQGLPVESDWIKDCEGKAVKLLDPNRWKPPTNHKYLFIWMRRDFRQQAKSQIKMVELFIPTKATRQELRAMERGNAKDTQACLEMFRKEYDCEVLMVDFEDLITKPVDTSRVIADYIKEHTDITLNTELMAIHVVDRSPDCYPGMLESQFIDRGN